MNRVPGGPGRQLHLREVHRAHGGADVAVLDQLAGDLRADALLRLLGGAADMRRQDDVVEALQRRDETLAVGGRLVGEHVDGRAAQMAAPARRVGERVEVDHRAAAVVDEVGALLHRARSRRAPIMPCGRRRLRHVQAHDVACASSSPRLPTGSVLPWRSLSVRSKIDDPHAHGLGQRRELAADIAVADDAQRLAAHLAGCPSADLSQPP